ncbi:WG repeat-containing protein [Rhodovibrio salinarum]|uniref:WG containing repeat-containing protein n=1 Tax=Rhodovibrio salinarum TaxID=1087 RepID=A0A934V2V2_9PROT|nr:WG repeat-containing protein [Rhodovibrio salinarum]MBK1699131.1 hypothetical protein [Rhodovibrio salinarum]
MSDGFPMRALFVAQLGGALMACALLWPVPSAQAQAQTCKASGRAHAFEALYPSETPTPRGTDCMAALGNGMAAVRLPALGVHIDDVAAARGLKDHRWGLIDRDGKLVAAPQFDAVKPFAQGLAAAKDGSDWGFIDASGNWVVDAAFQDAKPFAEIGIAPVKRDYHWTLIGRDDHDLDIDLGENVASIEVGAGDPAPVRTTYHAVHTAPDGRQLVVSGDMEVLGRFGDPEENLFRVSFDDGVGVLNGDSILVVPPFYDSIDAPNEEGGLWIANRGSAGQTLLKPDGTVVGDDYRNVRRLSDDFWLVVDRDSQLAILDRNGTVLTKVDRDAYYNLDRVGPFVVYQAEDGPRVLAPGAQEPLVLEDGFTAEMVLDNSLLVLGDGEGGIGGLVSRAGHKLLRKTHKWVGQIDSIEVRGGSYWMKNAQRNFLNVLGPDLQPTLTPEVRDKVGEYGLEVVQRVPEDEGPVPIAILTRGHCNCAGEGAGLLLSDGRIVVDQAWQKVTPLDEDPTQTRDSRFAVETADGVGMIDGHGKVVLAATRNSIAKFQHGYAMTYADGAVQALDREGKLYDLPPAFGMDVVAPGFLAYQKTAAADALLRLYDIQAGEPRGEAKFQAIEDFVDGQAIATAADGKVGVIDTNGDWTLSPRYGYVERLNGQLWAVQHKPSETFFNREPRAIVDASGEMIVPYTSQLQIAPWPDGRILVYCGCNDDHLDRLLSPSGEIELDGRKTKFARVGNWVRTARRPATGYLTADGDWALPLRVGVGSSFHEDSGHALFRDHTGPHIIDQQGERVADLETAWWSWPADSDWLIGSDHVAGKTVYADAQGEPALRLESQAGAFRNGVALSRADRDEPAVWIDNSGTPLDIGRYRDLGMLSDDGLAFAAGAEGVYGYIDRKGRYLIPPVYSNATAFSDGRAVVTTGYNAMMIDRTGRPVARVTQRCGVRVLYGPDNRRVWPEAMPSNCR